MADDVAASAIEGDSRLVLGKYVPFARLSHGGAAEVFLAIGRGPVGFNKLAVIKRLRNANDTGSIEMFLDEARLSARLSHPNIVNTYEVGEANGQYFLAMEYLDGQPLQSVLTKRAVREKPLDERAAAFIAMQALKGLHYAHELADYDGSPLDVVHRDVSPHNLFLTYQGEVKLLDFGIAKAALNFTHTETGVFKGKVRYMAPEQIGERNIDRRADVFALGVVLWEMLAGRALYSGRADVASMVTRITGSDPPPIRTIRRDVSPEIEAIVAKALRRDRDLRYATADEMRADLDRALRGQQEGADLALARMVNEMFAETRDKVQTRIRTFLAEMPAIPTSSGMVPTLSQAPEFYSPISGEPRSGLTATGLTGLTGLTGGSNASSLASPILSTAGLSARPPRKSWSWSWGAAGAALLVAAGVIVLRESPASNPDPAAAAPVPPPAVAAPLPSTTIVHVETSPSGALVEWNGQPLARTPADLDLPPGTQGLKVSYDGYEPATLTVDVKPGEPTARALVLRTKADPTPNATPSHQRRAPRTYYAPAPKKQAPPPAAPSASASAAAAAAKIRVVEDNAAAAKTAPRAKIRVVDDNQP